MRATLLALLVAAEVAAAPRVLNRLSPYPRLDRRDRLTSGTAPSPYYVTILADSYALPGGECSGQTLQTSLGANITWTRSSSAWCNKSDGTFVQLSSNQARASSVGGKPSVLVEGARTNFVLQNRDLANAAWTPTNASCTKNATGVDGVSSSASTCTASNNSGNVLQTVSISSGSYNVSAFVKRVSGTGILYLTADGSSFYQLSSGNCRKTTDFSAAEPSTDFWVRCSVAVPYVGAPNVGVLFQLSGDSASFDMLQLEAGQVATSPLATTSTSVARATEVGSFSVPAAFSNLLGCMRMGVTPIFTGSPPGNFIRFVSRGASVYYLGLAQSGDNWGAFDGATLPSLSAGYTAFSRKHYATRWNKAANILRVENLTAAAGVQSAFNTWSTDSTFYLGAESASASYPAWGYLNNVGFADTYAGCVL